MGKPDRRGPRPIQERQEPRTLPLFAERESDRPASTDEDPNEARDRVMQVYWSATNQMLVLGWAAHRSRNSEHRRALMELHELETRRKELARLLLGSVWGIHFNPRSEPSLHNARLSA
jgi:hypothetical protein